MTEIQERLVRSCEPEPNTGCWLWALSIGGNGYARIWFKARYQQASRVAFEAFIAPIPSGKELDHLCRVRSCINPAHLEPVSGRENLMRGNGWGAKNARKTCCLRGHQFTTENTFRRKLGRECRECRRLSWQRTTKAFCAEAKP